ncbi:putative membrane protein YphA (DoxX/SURF4 family) [Nocardioides albertanoniae]|uniref:Putative membrane protein YphA (DoxX/SURF4 family) n=1 Tax=Nocardioides albertanoniae TaxID=1175486 RepID=A0A543A7S0_9ACTN|nr:MauE/DoxX family redox-associated membrane protein [Nocardioides albertanoniae]TQL68652.1 putative membrane protein YphA (DoxX/SURF4 family) [Nocardioides albertanoniae]
MRTRADIFGWVGLAGRLYLGFVFLAAGIAKLPEPTITEQAVRGYQLLPWQLAATYAIAMPIAEIILGAMLVLGLFTRTAAVAVALGLCSFLLGITSAWVRGLDIDCGCFGGGGASADPAYLADTFRDLGWLAIAVFLILLRRTKLALDDLLFRRDPVALEGYSESSKKTELGSST